MDAISTFFLDPQTRVGLMLAAAAVPLGVFGWWTWYELSGASVRRQKPLRKFDKGLLEFAFEEQPEQWAAIRERGTVSMDEVARAAAPRLLKNHGRSNASGGEPRPL